MRAFAATWQGDLETAGSAIAQGRGLQGAPAINEQFDYLQALADYYRGELETATAGFTALVWLRVVGTVTISSPLS